MAFADDLPDLRESDFPHLVAAGYRVRSPRTIEYNCIAWAAEDSARWWEPDTDFQDGDRVYYWPVGGDPPKFTVAAVADAFRTQGYEPCQDGNKERGWEKVAIYADWKGATHAARQRRNGVWTSKLGKSHDIDHRTPEALCGPGYGTIAMFMRRRVKLKRPSKRASR